MSMYLFCRKCPPERVLESDIERARKEQQVKEAVPMGRIVDFRMLKEALNELGMK